MPYKVKERRYLKSLGKKAEQGLRYWALIDTQILPYSAILDDYLNKDFWSGKIYVIKLIF